MKEEIENDEVNSSEEEMFEHHAFTADKGQEIIRIDKFLICRIPNISRNKLQLAAKNGNILVNDVKVKQNYKVKPGDKISMVLPYPVRDTEILPEDIPLDIVYEDDALLVLNKQAGLVVHPGFGNFTGTLVNGLVNHFDNLPENDESHKGRPGLVHRLDKDTSGLMVIAKTEQALTHLAKQFFNRTTERLYNALVWGDFEEDEGRIEGRIGRSLKDRKMMGVFEEGEYGKHAVTHYKVLHRFGYISLIQCKLETGRTHQIRAHMKHIGHPLFNDYTYGGNKILKGTTFTKYKQFVNNCFEVLPRQALHARTLGFEHPETGEYMRFDSAIPDDIQACIDKWTVYAKSAM